MNKTDIILFGQGYLNRKALKYDEENQVIKGKMSIRTSDCNIVTFDVYSTEFTSNNKKNPSFKSFKTVLDEYKDSTMVNNLNECDKIEIKLSKNISYPNASITSKTYHHEETNKIETYHSNKLNFIHRLDEIQKPEIYFKMYGIHIENVKERLLECNIIDYQGIAQPIQLNCDIDLGLKVNSFVDIIGKVREGIENGEYVKEYRVIKARKSNKFTLEDIKIAKENYNKYIEETQELPY